MTVILSSATLQLPSRLAAHNEVVCSFSGFPAPFDASRHFITALIGGLRQVVSESSGTLVLTADCSTHIGCSQLWADAPTLAINHLYDPWGCVSQA